MDITNEDTRHLIYFFWRDGKNSVQISNKINEVLGEGTISDRTCRRWIERFEEGNFNAKDVPRCEKLPSRWRRCIDAGGAYFTAEREEE